MASVVVGVGIAVSLAVAKRRLTNAHPHREAEVMRMTELQEYKMNNRDLQRYVDACELSSLAYSIENSGTMVTLSSKETVLQAFGKSDLSGRNQFGSVPFLITKRAGCLYIALRGSYDMSDAVIDLSVWPVRIKDSSKICGPMLMVGAAKRISKVLQNWFKSKKHLLKDVKTVVVTGHSLGGAVAVLLSCMSEEWFHCPNHQAQLKLVTFGAPPVISAKYERDEADGTVAYLCSDLHESVHFAHVHDAVPKAFKTAGFGWLEYFHPGDVVILCEKVKPRLLPAGSCIRTHHAQQNWCMHSAYAGLETVKAHSLAKYSQCLVGSEDEKAEEGSSFLGSVSGHSITLNVRSRQVEDLKVQDGKLNLNEVNIAEGANVILNTTTDNGEEKTTWKARVAEYIRNVVYDGMTGDDVKEFLCAVEMQLMNKKLATVKYAWGCVRNGMSRSEVEELLLNMEDAIAAFLKAGECELELNACQSQQGGESEELIEGLVWEGMSRGDVEGFLSTLELELKKRNLDYSASFLKASQLVQDVMTREDALRVLRCVKDAIEALWSNAPESTSASDNYGHSSSAVNESHGSFAVNESPGSSAVNESPGSSAMNESPGSSALLESLEGTALEGMSEADVKNLLCWLHGGGQ